MNPSTAIKITSVDETEKGQKRAEERFGKFAKRMDKMSGETGLTRLGKQVEGLKKFGKLEFGFESLSRIGGISREAGEGVGALTRNILGLGGAAPGAFGAVVEGAGLAVGATAAVAAAAVGAGVVTYKLGEKWAGAGAKIGRAAEGLGVTSAWLQSTTSANERFGVSTDQTAAAVDGFASTMYDAKFGANNLALGAMRQLNVQMKQTKDGAIDVAGTFDDVTDAIARQKDPLVQRRLAQVFGLQGILPAIRAGGAQLAAAKDDYLKSGAALSEDQVAEAGKVEQKTVRFRQHVGALEKKLGMAAMPAAGAMADTGVTALHDPGKAAHEVMDSARGLAHQGLEAGRHLIEGAKQVGPIIGSEFEAFVRRIEHQESRGRQFDRTGQPLISKAGAVGAMQVLEDTGQRAAKKAGIPWDRDRFFHDKGYNEQIGTAELHGLYQKYGGDEVLTAAAYNAGPGAVDRWVKRFGDPRKGQISDEDFAQAIPFKETRGYVQNTAQGAKAHVEITLKGAPQGTTVRTSGAPGVEVALNLHKSLDGNP